MADEENEKNGGNEGNEGNEGSGGNEKKPPRRVGLRRYGKNPRPVRPGDSQMINRLLPFEWNDQRSEACVMLAQGKSLVETAKKVGISLTQLDRWMSHPDFTSEIDRVTLMTGIALPAYRIRIAKAAIQQRIDAEGVVLTKKDILEWLKYAQEEMDSIKETLLAALQQSALDNAIAGNPGLLAGTPARIRGTAERGSIELVQAQEPGTEDPDELEPGDIPPD